MSALEIIEPIEAREPKLGIKSSFSKLKQTIATLSLHFLATPGSSVLKVTRAESTPGEDRSEGDLEFEALQLDAVSKLLIDHGFEKAEIEVVLGGIVNSSLLEAQVEAMIVALELFIPLVEVTFADSGLPKSAERTGGKRFPKNLRYSRGLIDVCGGTRTVATEVLEVFRDWILDRHVPSTHVEIEKELKKRVFNLASQTQFLITRTTSGETPLSFNTIGLYRYMLEVERVALNFDEKKGTTRILFAALNQSLLPGLKSTGSTIELDVSDEDPSKFSRREIEDMLKLETKFRELSYVKSVEVARRVDTGLSQPEVDLAFSDVSLRLSAPRAAMNVIYYGVPGSGKSHEISRQISEKDSVERVVFHPDYLYSTFVGQILPVSDKGEISYQFKPGPFTKLLQSAVESPDVEHILIIEEINRGNAAAIFGDIFQLLDRQDTGESKYPISNPEIASCVFGDSSKLVVLPSNLRLLATMNTSDQNVFTLDTAFQRRWTMKMVRNDISKVSYGSEKILDTTVSWEKFNTVMNRVIMSTNTGTVSTEDKRLGAFFVREEDLNFTSEGDDSNIFAEKVLKYLWDDALKFNRESLFLSSDELSLEDVISNFNFSVGDDRWTAVFKSNICAELFTSPAVIAEGE